MFEKSKGGINMAYSLKRCSGDKTIDKKGNPIPKHLYALVYDAGATQRKREIESKISGKKKMDVFGERKEISIKRIDKLMTEDGEPKAEYIYSILKEKLLKYFTTDEEQAIEIAEKETAHILNNWRTIVEKAYL
jgi:hypothetical protein